MQKDIRDTALFKEAEAIYTALRRPGSGLLTDAAEMSAAPGGAEAVFAGTMMAKLEGGAQTRICHVNLKNGDVRVLTFGPGTDRLPKYSPDGKQVAFLSDRHKAGDYQVYMLDLASGAATPTQAADGWVEYFHWSPDSKSILLGVAGHGADVAGGQGAVTSKKTDEALPAWMPIVESGDESFRWRSAWVLDVASGKARKVSKDGDNTWETVWCGNDKLASVISPGPGEGLWYTAKLFTIDVKTGAAKEIYKPKDQLGWPAGAPSGKHVAVVEAVCSDRWIVAGDLRLIDTATGKVTNVDTKMVDVNVTEWLSDDKLLVAGIRGFESVVGVVDAAAKTYADIWASREITTGGRDVNVSPFNDAGDFVLVGENYTRSPELAVVRGGKYQAVKSFECGYAEYAKDIAKVEEVTWKAPDGLEIQGWVLLPKGKGPFPLVLHVHGGPVSHWRNRWLGRTGANMLMLLKRGIAIFWPNPRGSSGRGQDFARHVLGDMCGADTYDYLSGLDHLVKLGIADPKRLGVTGGSYGGLMTSWLITQDNRFAAAVSSSPVTNMVTEHLISNIPHFVSLFLNDTYTNPTGKYFTRSPIMHAHKVKTPTLNLCGALDRCTPPEEAMQFHNALLENNVKSVLVTYPEEGHGVRKFPTLFDVSARLVGWFEEHLGVKK